MIATKTLNAINEYLEAAQDREHRTHLGASIIGKPCSREIWYIFRWAEKELFDGQMLRLFERGQLEESRFVAYLQGIGCETWPVNPDTGEQWRLTYCNGHMGGSTDCIAMGIPDLPPNVPFDVECKTHKDSSFKQLQKQGLHASKPEHFGQTQIYTVGNGLEWALYMAVNKNDDHLHLELIKANPPYVATLIDKAQRIIDSPKPPPRISESPAFYMCKSFCSFSEICHQKKLPEVNCRTCRHSAPVMDGKWLCRKYEYHLSKEEQQTGCDSYALNVGMQETIDED